MRLVLFLKAADVPAGSRWITLHPNGPDEKGQPVMIQPNSDGSAHVVGGAGGSLNYLKLRNVRSVEDYAKDTEAKRVKKNAQKKEQAKKDKEAGIYESKAKAKENVRTQEANEEHDFVKTVADSLGWDKSKMVFPEDEFKGASEAAANKARKKFHTDLVQQARDAVAEVRQHVLKDADARLQANLKEVPVTSDDDNVISVQDLNPIPTNTAGLGFATKYGERAKEAGMTEAEVAEQKAIRDKDKTPEQREAMIKRGAVNKATAEEMKSLRDPSVKLKTGQVDTSKASVLIKAEKKLKTAKKNARKARAEIDTSEVEPKAYVIAADEEVSDEAVEEDLSNDLRTINARAFLSEYKKIGGGDDTLGKYLGIGAYNSVNALALAVSGDALVDRSVVDVLGISGAAQVLARRLQADLPEAQAKRVAEGVAEFHLNNYMETAAKSLEKAQAFMAQAQAMQVTDLSTAVDIKAAQEINKRHAEAILSAQTIIGESLGEMEANAALTLALKRPGDRNKPFTVSLGKTALEHGIAQVRALGLQRGDYSFEHTAGQLFLKITPEGMGRLAKPVNRADIEQVHRNLGIIAGDQDEDDWLPQGFANRPDLVMDVKPGVAPRLAEPFTPGGDLEKSVRDYIGGRAADGDNAADIMGDLQSADFVKKSGDPAAYQKALDAAAPLHGADGQILRAEDMQPAFDKLADDFVSNRYGGTRSGINQQKVTLNDQTADALHRALGETPAGVSAYKQIGELDHNDQRTLREFFHKEVAKESPETAAQRAELEKHVADEPERQSQDMFGEMADNPEWKEWNNKKDQLSSAVNSGSLTWDKYIEAMHGPEKAYEAVQDLIKSKVNKSFADAHNTLNPDSPIKVGRQTIRNNLAHLDMTDPAARAKRQESDRARIDALRERSQGRYAGGSVSDKLDAARAQEEAFNQSQMGFFSSEDAPETKDRPLGGDERHSIGHIAERQVAGMMDHYGKGFDARQPVKMFQPSMSGGTNAPRQRLIKMMEANKRVVAAFGTGCVHGDTVLDDVDGNRRTFYQWWLAGEAPMVWAVADNGALVHQQASRVFVKGVAKMLRVTFGTRSIVVSANHRFLTSRGWVVASQIKSGDALVASRLLDSLTVGSESVDPFSAIAVSQALKAGAESPASDDAARLHDVLAYDPHASGITQDSYPRYGMDGDLCGAPLHAVQETAQVGSQLPADAQRHIHFCRHTGATEPSLLHTRSHPHTARRARRDSLHPSALMTVPEGGYPIPVAGGERPAHRRQALPLFPPLAFEDQQTADAIPHHCSAGASANTSAMSALLAQYLPLVTRGEWFSESNPVRSPPPEQISIPDRSQQCRTATPRGYSPYRLDTVLTVSYAGHYTIFDVHVPKHHNYFAHGVCHHNSGKTAIQLGAFSHLHGKGKVKRGIFLVPSVVQGQFGGAALQFLQPGKFNWHIKPGASQAERIAAYKNPEHDFCAMTHSAFGADMVHLAAKSAGVSEADMGEQLNAMAPDQRKAWMKKIMTDEGINFDFLSVDEGQVTLNRQGKENSRLANVVDSFSAHTPYYMTASADTVKNDTCLHPTTPLFDPVRNVTRSVAEWRALGLRPFVWALDEQSQEARIIEACVPFIKTRHRPMFEVKVSGGRSIKVAANHRFLTPTGWEHLSNLSIGDRIGAAPLLPLGSRDERQTAADPLFSPNDGRAVRRSECNEARTLSIALNALAFVRRSIANVCDAVACALYCLRTLQDWRDRCSPLSHQCDARFLSASMGAPVFESSDGYRPAAPVLRSSDGSACSVLYYAIEAIIPIADADIYDLEVPVFHNYLACGLWNHNSEIFDMFQKMDPERYKDRDAFMRRYGPDTVGSKDALRREMARYMYPSKIDPDIKVTKTDASTELSEGQNMALEEVDKHLSTMYLANMEGKVDVDAARAVSPASFEGEPPENHEKIAKDLQRNTGLLKSSAVQRIINTHPDNPAVDNLAKLAKERKGKPGLVFAHSLAAVKMIGERLEKEGHKVITITGADSAQDKEKKRAAYQNGDGDILVASDAAAVGMNVQRGQWCYQHDTPQTAMVHAQRQGRINRIGQKNDVELLDSVPNHPEIHKARDRLTKKYALRDMMTTPLEGLDETGVAKYIKDRDVMAEQKSEAA